MERLLMQLDFRLCHGITQLFSNDYRAAFFCLGKQNNEFLSSEPRGNVTIAQAGFDNCRDKLETGSPGQMSIQIVN